MADYCQNTQQTMFSLYLFPRWRACTLRLARSIDSCADLCFYGMTRVWMQDSSALECRAQLTAINSIIFRFILLYFRSRSSSQASSVWMQASIPRFTVISPKIPEEIVKRKPARPEFWSSGYLHSSHRTWKNCGVLRHNSPFPSESSNFGSNWSAIGW